jgi:hypothetical protein
LDNAMSPVAQLEDLEYEHQSERYSLSRHGGRGPATHLVFCDLSEAKLEFCVQEATPYSPGLRTS